MKNYKVYICLICKNKNNDQNEFYPFCSKRCSQLDLNRWLLGNYVITKNLDLEE